MGWTTVLARGGSARDFDVEYIDADGRVQNVVLQSVWGVAFERVLPVRAFPSYRGQRNFPGWYYACTMDSHVGFESWLERDHAIALDHDRDIVAFSSQPFWLSWNAAAGPRRHAPDFFARKADGSGIVIDVRADDQIEAGDAEAFAVTEIACREVGWEFLRVGIPDPVRARNLRWLSRYRHRRYRGAAAVSDRLMDVFARPAELLAGAGLAGDPLATLPVLFHLMWCQVLAADLAKSVLGPSTSVCRAEGG